MKKGVETDFTYLLENDAFEKYTELKKEVCFIWI